MFVTGEPRSGTTLMHALMSVDPDARALRFWEVMYPRAPPGVAGRRRPAPRPAPTPTGARSTPSCRSGCTRHPYNDMLGDGLPEDERTWAFDFRVMTPTAWWRVPMQTLVAGPADRCRRAVPHPPDDAAAVPVRPAAEVLGAQGFPRLPAAGVLRRLSRCDLVWLHRDPVQVAASRTMMMADILDGHRRAGRPPGRGEDAPGPDAGKHRQHDVQSADRRSAYPARSLHGLRCRPDRHGPELLRLLPVGR